MEKKRKPKRANRIQDRLLTLLAGTAGALDAMGDFTYNPYPYLYSSLGMSYRKESIDGAVRDLTKRGLIEGNKYEGLRLTSAGADVKKSLYLARQREWDGKWRVVIFDIPEAQRKIRDDLRFELKKLGFGSWQRSVWVTPFDISAELDAYLRRQNLSEMVQIVVGERFGRLNDRDFAAKIWSLKDLSEKYVRLLADWAEELRRESTAEERRHAAAFFHNRYLGILAADPQLPSGLLPAGWVGDDAAKLFKKLKLILIVGEPSQS